MKMIIKILLWPLKLIWANLVLWSLFLLSLLPHPEIKKNDRFIVLKDVAMNGLLHYNAPCTGGFKCIIPKDTGLVAFSDSGRISMGFGCVPENKKEFEKNMCQKKTEMIPNTPGIRLLSNIGILEKRQTK